MSRQDQSKTLHCECGSEEYHIKWTPDGEKWAVCASCGRPTGVVGIGERKKQEWSKQQ